MQCLLSSHAKWINLRYKTYGHLFQGRFPSILCLKEAHVIELLRYIHLNPVRAGLVARPEEWDWSSYRGLMGHGDGFTLDVEAALRWFDDDIDTARGRLERFVLDGLGGTARYEGERPAGLPEVPARKDPTPGPRDTSAILSRLLASVASKTGLTEELLRGPSRIAALVCARRLLIRRAIAEGVMIGELAIFLGRTVDAIYKTNKSECRCCSICSGYV